MADVQLIARLIRVTLEAQIPPTILSMIFLVEYSEMHRNCHA